MATFGNTNFGTGGGTGIEDEIKGGLFQMGAIGGDADKITAELNITIEAHKCKCALYDSNKDIVANGVTDEVDVPVQAHTSTDFAFSGTKPTLVADAWYYIVVWGESTTGDAYFRVQTSEGDNTYKDAPQGYNNFPDTFAATAHLSDYLNNIYCTYTEGGVAHTHTPSDTLSISDAVAYKQDHVQALADTLTMSDSVEYVLTKGAVPVVKRPRIPYGLKPARVVKVGRVGV